MLPPGRGRPAPEDDPYGAPLRRGRPAPPLLRRDGVNGVRGWTTIVLAGLRDLAQRRVAGHDRDGVGLDAGALAQPLVVADLVAR